MRLGIYLTRRAMLKVLAPVIDAAQARGHHTVLVAERLPAKRGDHLDLAELRGLWPEATLALRHGGEWPMLDALVGIVGVLPRVLPCRTVGVDQFYDCWLQPPRGGRDFTMAYTSEYHREQHRRLWSFEHDLIAQTRVVGWLPADQQVAAMRSVSGVRDAAVFFALKLRVPEPWRHSAQGRAAYQAIARAAKATARAQGLRFIVKSRAKNGDPLWLRWMADEYIRDAHMVPFTSLRLLARAQWAVHFESGAAFEAALMGAYGLAIAVPQSHVVRLPGGDLTFGRAAWNDWPGVAQYGMPSGAVPLVDPQARARYLATWLGPCDGRAGARVVMIAEEEA